MSRRRTLLGFVAGAVSATVVAGGVAFAAMPSTSNGVTTMCANKSTGAARVIDYQAGKRCSSSERTVSIRPGVVSKGTWSSSRAYAPGDLVRTADGATYLARTSSTGKAPASTSSAWAKVASAPTPKPTAYGHSMNLYVPSMDSSKRTQVWKETVPAGSYLVNGRFTLVGATTELTSIRCAMGSVPDGTTVADGALEDQFFMWADFPVSSAAWANVPMASTVTLASTGDVVVRCYTSAGTANRNVHVRVTLLPVGAAVGSFGS